MKNHRISECDYGFDDIDLTFVVRKDYEQGFLLPSPL